MSLTETLATSPMSAHGSTNSSPSKRERLVESAAELFHYRGMASTSLADIAKHADIPIGNVYYYFKTKEELALAAIARHRQSFSALYQQFDTTIGDPRQRLIEAVRHYESLKDIYAKHGCPVGRVVQDCAEVEKDTAAREAAKALADFVNWARQQFEALGHDDFAGAHSVSLMSRIQGAVLMAKAFAQPEIISQEIERLVEWLTALPNKKIFLGKAALSASPLAAADH